MGVKNALKVGDVLYRVNPRKLSVKAFTINAPEEVYNFTTTTHENFSIECEKKHSQLPLDKVSFPFEHKGLLYFLCEDEANNYIKTQIGL
jgi:hypothetical protein